MAASDLLKFKRGTQTALQPLIDNRQGEDGCFYLTVDETNAPEASSRLYIGRSDGRIVPVNQGIVTVSSINDLSSNLANGNLRAGDFAYISGDNILAVYNGQIWVQINSQEDHFLTAAAYTVIESNGVATINWRSDVNNGTHPSASFTVTGSKGITVSQGTVGNSNSQLVIEGDEYALTGSVDAVSEEYAEIKLSSDSRANAGTVKILAGDDIELANGQNLNEIEISAHNTKNSQMVITNVTNDGDGFNIGVRDTDQILKSAVFDPTIRYGIDAVTGQPTTTAHYVNGAAVLGVYSKTDIDEKLKGLNAMTYKGTVGTGGSVAILVSGIQDPSIGNTYKASSELSNIPIKTAGGTISSTGTAKTGDLLIANGDEDSTGGIITSTLYYDIITSGDDVEDTTYVVQADGYGIKIVDSHSATIGGLKLLAGTAIGLEGSGTNNREVTVKHASLNSGQASITTEAAAETQQNATDLTKTLVTGITVNTEGHVTGITTQQVTFKDSNATLQSVTDTITGNANNKEATIQTAVTLANSAGVNTSKNDSFKLASDNLKITVNASTKTVTVNHVWESF